MSRFVAPAGFELAADGSSGDVGIVTVGGVLSRAMFMFARCLYRARFNLERCDMVERWPSSGLSSLFSSSSELASGRKN